MPIILLLSIPQSPEGELRTWEAVAEDNTASNALVKAYVPPYNNKDNPFSTWIKMVLLQT